MLIQQNCRVNVTIAIKVRGGDAARTFEGRPCSDCAAFNRLDAADESGAVSFNTVRLLMEFIKHVLDILKS